MRYWLFKTEPETYSFAQLLRDRKTAWNGVRNFQARNFLKEVQSGDRVIIYHSGKNPAAVGLAQVIREAYPEVDPERKGEWVQLDIAPFQAFSREVSLTQMKSTPGLKDLLLIKQSRLSCMPLTEEEFKIIQNLGGLT